MSRLMFVTPPSFANGDVLGASQVAVLLNNQHYIHENLSPQPGVEQVAFVNGDESWSQCGTWRGTHAGNSNQLHLKGSLSVSSGTSNRLRIYLKDTGTALWTSSSYGVGTHAIDEQIDFSSHPSGDHPNGGETIEVQLWIYGDCTFTMYYVCEEIADGSITYVGPGGFTDGVVVYADNMDQLEHNQDVFRALISPRIGFRMVQQVGWFTSYDEHHLGTWWIRHTGESNQVRIIGRYKTDNSGAVSLRLYYKDMVTHVKSWTLGGGGIVTNWRSFDFTEDVSSYGSPHPVTGEDVPIKITLLDKDDKPRTHGFVDIYYMGEQISSISGSWESGETSAPGDMVLGNTASNAKRLQLIADNQKYLAGDSGGGYTSSVAPLYYRNYYPLQASLKHQWHSLHAGGVPAIGMVRKFDQLRYNVKADTTAKLTWGHLTREKHQSSIGLEGVNYNGMKVVDLEAIPALPAGMFYWVQTSDNWESVHDIPENARNVFLLIEWPGSTRIPGPLYEEDTNEVRSNTQELDDI